MDDKKQPQREREDEQLKIIVFEWLNNNNITNILIGRERRKKEEGSSKEIHTLPEYSSNIV